MTDETPFQADQRMIRDLRAQVEALTRRQCSKGHEQDRVWSICRLCQLEGALDEALAQVEALTREVARADREARDAIAAHDDVEQQRDEARAALREVEWSVYAQSADAGPESDPFACPACQRLRPHGHDSGCVIRRALGEAP